MQIEGLAQADPGSLCAGQALANARQDNFEKIAAPTPVCVRGAGGTQALNSGVRSPQGKFLQFRDRDGRTDHPLFDGILAPAVQAHGSGKAGRAVGTAGATGESVKALAAGSTLPEVPDGRRCFTGWASKSKVPRQLRQPGESLRLSQS